MHVRNKTESYYNAHNFTYIYIAFKQSSITMLNNIINSNDKIESQLQQEDDDPFGLNTIYKILKHKPSSNNYLAIKDTAYICKIQSGRQIQRLYC